jgi:hypothetical protein
MPVSDPSDQIPREAPDGGRGAATPAEPFRSLRANFGMLLGVADFEAIVSHSRGKAWLHNAWLHEAGVVWGLAVSIDPAKGEVRVGRGLALDKPGHELHLDADACVNVGRWFDEHAKDADLLAALTQTPDGRSRFDAHVTIRFHACLTRQVPGLNSPCEGDDRSTTYSRVYETVELALVPGPAPVVPTHDDHDIRLLFALDPPAVGGDGAVTEGDQAVLDERTRIVGLAFADQPAACVAAIRRFAGGRIPAPPGEGDDELGPSLFPARDPSPLVLAEIEGLTLQSLAPNPGWDLVAGDVSMSSLPVLLSTSTIQDLLVRSLLAASPIDPPDGLAGPRVDRGSILLAGTTLTMAVDAPLSAASVAPSAFSVTQFDVLSGWSAIAFTSTYAPADRTVRLSLTTPPTGLLLRVIARGTGPTPLLGENLAPLAGATSDPTGHDRDARDFLHTITL